MNGRTIRLGFIAVLVTMAAGVASAAELPDLRTATIDQTHFDSLIGQAVNIPHGRTRRPGDLAVQDNPEAYFIPQQLLERIDKVYRTASTAPPPQDLKSIYYDMPDIAEAVSSATEGSVCRPGCCGPEDCRNIKSNCIGLPAFRRFSHQIGGGAEPYPTSYGWFGWTVDKTLSNPEISEDRPAWTYTSGADKMDWAYNVRVDAATEMVAVFCQEAVVPRIRVSSPSVGEWQRIDLEMEWGFLDAEEAKGAVPDVSPRNPGLPLVALGR